MRYLVIGFCVFAAACAGAPPTAPTSSATTSYSSQIGGGSVATASKGGSDLPFKGDLQATEAVNGQLHHLTGAGNGTHLGRFTYAADITVDPATGNGVGTVVWTAANGEQVFASTAGQRVFVAFPTIGLKETQTITGGTGRFVDASGTIIVERSLDVPTHVTTGSFDGGINLGH
jgi:hypothetical protein